MIAGFRLCALTLLAGLAFAGTHVVPARPVHPIATNPSHTTASAVITSYCSTCHRNGRASLDLDGPMDLRDLRQNRASWEKVIQVLRNGRMPPRRFPQPTPEERVLLGQWLETELAHIQANGDFRYRLRRLRRSEYRNTIRDLLGVDVPPNDELPADESHWDLAHELPVISNEILGKYQATTDKIIAGLDLAQLIPAHVPGYLETLTLLVSTRLPAIDAEIARVFLASFTRHAYRRPVSPEEIDNLTTIFQHSTSAGIGFDDSLKAALRSVLLSPEFLYRIETPISSAAPDQVNEFELASRLAFLLWNSAPDAELLNLAEQGLLRANLSGQARRMLKDERLKNFALAFATDWLDLDKLAEADIDEDLRQAMRLETEQFVSQIIIQDRDLLELVSANYAFVNERLARHYGIRDVLGKQLRRVATVGTVRGGLLTQASILTTTSRGGETRPVQRGKWILDKILGTPPPAPPTGLLEAFDKTRKGFGAGSLREHLAQHRENPSCAHCHANMDSLGLALENFDAMGAWRANHNPIEAEHHPENDALNGPADLKKHLLKKRTQFVRAFADRLVSYAIGRKPLQMADAEDAARRPLFSRLILELVQSDTFQSRCLD